MKSNGRKTLALFLHSYYPELETMNRLERAPSFIIIIVNLFIFDLDNLVRPGFKVWHLGLLQWKRLKLMVTFGFVFVPSEVAFRSLPRDIKGGKGSGPNYFPLTTNKHSFISPHSKYITMSALQKGEIVLITGATGK